MTSVTSITRPPRSSPDQTERLAEEYEDKIRGDRLRDGKSRFTHRLDIQDSRLSQVFMWGVGIVGSVVTFVICYGVSAVIDMRSQVAVLVSRPASVEKDQYDKDYARLSDQVKRVEDRLGNIEQRQINTVTKRP